MLTAGAVDQAGEETSFSSFGKSVDVHANGFEVDSTLPGGERMKCSGTSMAAPNVTNLAAKLLALDSTLTVAQVTDVILRGAERSVDGRINLINPRRSVELLQATKAKSAAPTSAPPTGSADHTPPRTRARGAAPAGRTFGAADGVR